MTFIHYIRLDFKFGLLDCVHYNWLYVHNTRGFLLEFCSSILLVLVGLKNIVIPGTLS